MIEEGAKLGATHHLPAVLCKVPKHILWVTRNIETKMEKEKTQAKETEPSLPLQNGNNKQI